jgi:hypothetical protein
MDTESPLVGQAGMRFHRTPWPDNPGGGYAAMPGCAVARVFRVDPVNGTVDCVGAGSFRGAVWRGVHVVSPGASSNEGLRWLPLVTTLGGGLDPTKEMRLSGERDAFAVLAFLSGNASTPVCLGFLPGGPDELSHPEPGTRLERHASDVYSRLTADGTYEVSFADGSYLKIADAAQGADLTPLLGHDERPWQTAQAAPKRLHYQHASGVVIDVSPEGALTVTAPAGDVTVAGVSLVAHTHPHEDTLQGGNVRIVQTGAPA